MAEGEVKLRVQVEGAEAARDLVGRLKEAFQALAQTVKQVAGADIGANLKQVQEAFKQGAMSAQGMGGMVQLLSGGLSALATPMGVVAVSAGVLYETMNKATEAMEAAFREVRGLQAVTGMSATESKALADAFRLMGLEGGNTERAMFRLSAEIDQGGEKLAALGIRVQDVNGNLRPTGEVFLDIYRKLSSMGDAAQRNAMLLQLFGRAGRELAPLFAEGAGSLEKFMDKAKEMGVYTQEDQTQTLELVRAKAALSKAMEELWLNVGRAVIPIVEGITKVVGFFAEGLGAMVGLIKSAAQGDFPELLAAMGPLGAAFLVLSIPIEAIARSFRAIVATGKTVADLLVPPKGAGSMWEQFRKNLAGIEDAMAGRAPKAEAKGEAERPAEPEGGIDTAKGVAFRAKLREEQMKVDLRYFQEQSALETGSRVQALEAQRAFMSESIALERQKFEEESKLTTDPLKKVELERQYQLKRVALEGESRILLLKIQEAEAQDVKKATEDKLRTVRDAAEIEVALINQRKAQALDAVQAEGMAADDAAEHKKDIEVRAAEEIAAAKTKMIDETVAALKAEAAAHSNNAALQRETQLKMMDLAKQRQMVEIEAVNAVDRARAEAARAEDDRRAKEAGMFGQLFAMAEKYAAAEHRKYVTEQDITAAMEKQQALASQTMAAFFGGGGVKPEDMRAALEFQRTAGEMKKTGSTPFSVGWAEQQAAEQAGISAMGGGGGTAIISAGKDVAKAAEGQVVEALGAAKGEFAKLGDTIGKGMADAMKAGFDAIPDQLNRLLEFQAARR